MCIGHVDLLDVGDQRAGSEPLAVGLVQTLYERVVEDGAPLGQGVVGADLPAVGDVVGLLGAQDAGGHAAEQVVREADAAGPGEGEPVVAHAAGIGDAPVQVVDETRQRRRPEVLRPGRRDHEPGDAAVGVAQERDVAVRPRLAGDELVDEVLAVLGALAAEEVELAARAASAPHGRVDGDVLRVEHLAELPAVVTRQEGDLAEAEVVEEGAAVGRAAVVPRHLEHGGVPPPGLVAVGQPHVHRDGDAVGHRHVVVGRRAGGTGRAGHRLDGDHPDEEGEGDGDADRVQRAGRGPGSRHGPICTVAPLAQNLFLAPILRGPHGAWHDDDPAVQWPRR